MKRIIFCYAFITITLSIVFTGIVCSEPFQETSQLILAQDRSSKTIKSEKRFPHGYPKKKPDTIAQAIDILMVVLTPEQKNDIRNTSKNKLIQYHLSLGMWIRNNFGLWGGNTNLLNELGGGHPDDASFVLIEKLWMNLNE